MVEIKWLYKFYEKFKTGINRKSRVITNTFQHLIINKKLHTHTQNYINASVLNSAEIATISDLHLILLYCSRLVQFSKVSQCVAIYLFVIFQTDYISIQHIHLL